MSETRTDYRAFEASSTENRRLLRTEELILEVTEALIAAMAQQKLTKSQLAARLGKSPAFVTRSSTAAAISRCEPSRKSRMPPVEIHVAVVPVKAGNLNPPLAERPQVVYVDFPRNEAWTTVDRQPEGMMICEEIAPYGAAVAG